jgi:mannose-6-phosphate isomerase-like protein (cupin superfamily)
MKKSLAVAGVSAMLVLAWFVGRIHGRLEQVQAQDKVIYAMADKAGYKSTSPGVSIAPIWGDISKGAHATFSKFAAGQDNGWHTHTNDVSIVVLKGAYLYKDDDGEKRVGPGDFLRVPGGHKHWSGGDKKVGALFYEEGPAKFDFVPAK